MFMSYDGKLLSRAKVRLDDKRHSMENERVRRLEEAYRRSPRIKDLDSMISGNIANAVGLALSRGSDPVTAFAEARADNEYLQTERREQLKAAGLSADYTDEHYMCERCLDTGYRGTDICSCLDLLYKEEQRRELSELLKLGEQTFDSFCLDWYDDRPDPATGISPHKWMESVYDTCVEYARKFGKKSFNLFFTGGTGLGKTFLATSIAKTVSESGFSVVYDTAMSVFSRFEDDKFSKVSDSDAVKGELHRYMTCDLLILDDLGTELTTSFTVSCLYNIINTRLASGKKTIITSNLSPDEVGIRYSLQIASRLEGEYQVLKFFGKDIRILKKELQ